MRRADARSWCYRKQLRGRLMPANLWGVTVSESMIWRGVARVSVQV